MGIYNGKLATRMLFLHPDTLVGFQAIAEFVVVSDMFRSAASSLQAISERKGALPPSYSGHGYGYCIDVKVVECMAKLGFKTKKEFDQWMAARGWHCHRTDHVLGHESWHYNYFTPEEVAQFFTAGQRFTSGALEAKIQANYGSAFKMQPKEVQAALASLRIYDGAIDGNLGAASVQGIKLFQRTWGLPQDGVAGPKTHRVLAYVTAIPSYLDQAAA